MNGVRLYVAEGSCASTEKESMIYFHVSKSSVSRRVVYRGSTVSVRNSVLAFFQEFRARVNASFESGVKFGAPR